jgi:hypothetical protein
VCNQPDIEFIFYAHSKGLKYPNHTKALKNIQTWSELMYIYCFANIDDMILNDANFGGSFCRPGFLDNNMTRWHYSGSFYWMNNRILNKRQYLLRRGQEYYVSEKFPGTCCPTKEKCLTFLDFPNSGNDNLYESRCIDSFSILTNALNNKLDNKNTPHLHPRTPQPRPPTPIPSIDNDEERTHEPTMFKNHRILGGGMGGLR